MVDTPLLYIAILLFIASQIIYIEHKFKWRIFKIIPPIVILYFTVMTLSTLEIIPSGSDVDETYSSIKRYLLPAMIFLMLLELDIRVLFRVGKSTIATFFLASFTISIGFIVMFYLFHNHFSDESAWRAFGALSGSWLGGTSNMIAIQEALNLDDSKLGYVLLIDSIDYAIWGYGYFLMGGPYADRLQ